MLLHRQLPTFDAVAAGRKAVCSIDPGIRIHALNLEFGNAAVAANEIDDVVDDIIVKINGRPQRTHSAVQLNQLNGINGNDYLAKATGTSGQADRRHFLTIWFANPWRLDQNDRIAPAWNLVGIESFQVEVFLKAGIAAPFVEGTYEYDAPTADQIGLIGKILRQDFGAVGTSRDIQTLDKRDLYESIHMFPTVGGTTRSVESVQFIRNGVDLLDRITANQNQVKLLNWGLVPDTAAEPRFDLVFDYSDKIRDGMMAAGARELTMKVNWNGAANGVMPLLVQRVGAPE